MGVPSLHIVLSMPSNDKVPDEGQLNTARHLLGRNQQQSTCLAPRPTPARLHDCRWWPWGLHTLRHWALAPGEGPL
eukprot:14440009-Alexandrium_andersonii.AAC.1